MSLINSFNYVDRTANLGKRTESPLMVRFTFDGDFRRRVGETTGQGLAFRWLEKRYAWRGYTLNMAKQIANFYAAGNDTRPGYFRNFREYTWSDVSGWESKNVQRTMSTVRVVKIGGDMYAVEIDVDECDPILVRSDSVPATYDQWCGAFSNFYTGVAWAATHFGRTTPYTFESYYDEPLTVVEL